MSTDYGSPIHEIECQPLVVPDEIYTNGQPAVLRGLVSEWPVVSKSQVSDRALVNYLSDLYNGKPVNAFLAQPAANGRIFYNESVDGFNFVQSNVYLDDALNKIIEVAQQPTSPTYYIGSLELAQHLPALTEDTPLALKYSGARQSIWLGNQSLIAPHFDFPDNLACCVAGARKFRLFPPEQLNNLYVGPLDLTPAGQAISMVDVRNPDLHKYPRFADAMQTSMTATLRPGDAIFIPSMWWHSVESLNSLNGLINYWWRDTPAFLGAPQNALLHAIMSIKYLPKHQKAAWQHIFNQYVFESPEDMYDHLPEQIKARQDSMSETTARKLRVQLINKLK